MKEFRRFVRTLKSMIQIGYAVRALDALNLYLDRLGSKLSLDQWLTLAAIRLKAENELLANTPS